MSGSRWVWVKYTYIWYVKNTKVGIWVLFTVLCIICGSCNVCTTFCLLVRLLMDTWIGFTFWILCSEHGCTNIFKLAFSSFGYIPRSKIARLGINSMFCFFFKKKHIAILFSTATVPFYIPNNSVQGFQFLHVFFNICYILSFFFLRVDILVDMR